MTELLNRAFAFAAALPDEQQDEIANILLGLAGAEPSVLTLTPEEHADLDDADAEIRRGELLSLDEARALWAKHEL
jgi:hypothetical protein